METRFFHPNDSANLCVLPRESYARVSAIFILLSASVSRAGGTA